MIPYTGAECHMRGNDSVFGSHQLMIVEQAFGGLKGRFRWLNGRVIVHNPMEHAKIIPVGCLLHYLCMDHDQQFEVEWSQGVKLRCGDRVRPEKDHTLDAEGIREVLCNYMYRKNMP